MDGPDAPLLLEGTAGLGKTLPILVAAAKSAKRVAVVFPTHQLIDQALASWDLKTTLEAYPISVRAFRPRTHFEDSVAEYSEQKDLAFDADILFCTSISVIIDQRLRGAYNGSTARDVIIFDEADQLPEFAALANDLSITKADLSYLKITASNPQDTIESILKKHDAPIEIKAKAKVIKEALELGDVWYLKVGFSVEGALELKSRLPGRLLKRISNRASTIFVSATLSVNGSFSDFIRAMGIENKSSLSDMIEPESHGKLHFSFAVDDELGSEEWIDRVREEIEFSERPTLVVTPSHELAQRISETLTGVTVRTKLETTTQAAARMGGSEVLIAAGAWAGLDTPIAWKTIVVPRIPYTGPNNLYDVWDDDVESFNAQTPNRINSYIDTANTAARRLKQVFGRGLRKPTAECTVIICDPRIDRFSRIAPTRFQPAFFEGLRVSSSSTRSERDSGVRKEALKHHGATCMACKFIPFVLRQLEVHHLNPLADHNPRLTKLSDVVVLCRNCHGLAHAVSPPMPMAELIEKANSGRRMRPGLTMT